jgi:iron-sulfur cluster assembly protein
MTEATEDSTQAPAAPRDWDVKAMPVMVTAKAIEMVRIALKEEGLLETHGLRVAVQGGGCSGLQYALDFAKESRPGDFVYEIDGMKVYIDLASRKFLEGTKVDYVSGLQGNGFKFDNPNAQRSCGCGHSFS